MFVTVMLALRSRNLNFLSLSTQAFTCLYVCVHMIACRKACLDEYVLVEVCCDGAKGCAEPHGFAAKV